MTYDTDETVTNEAGGVQSKALVDCTLTPHAFLEIGKVLHQGAQKYGYGNAYLIPEQQHLQHALTHVLKYLAGDYTCDEDILHAATRLCLAIEVKARARLPRKPRQPEFDALVSVEHA